MTKRNQATTIICSWFLMRIASQQMKKTETKKAKLDLPYSQEAIAQVEARVQELKTLKELAEHTLRTMRKANAEAERNEEVRKARKMTPTMAAALERMVAGDHVEAYHPYGNRPTIYMWNGALNDMVSSSLVGRLWTAGYADWSRSQKGADKLSITDAGRAALKEYQDGPK